MNVKTYKTANAFLNALSEKLKLTSRNEGIDIQRLRLKIAFERLMARIFHKEPYQWLLKGGHAMELRINNPRTTKDIDLALKEKTLMSSNRKKQNILIHDELIELANINLNDFFNFRIEAPIMDLAAAPYGGARFPVISEVDDKVFSRFHLDIGVGDPNDEQCEIKIIDSFLAFAGINAVKIPMIGIEQQFAEKIHAYSLPRDGRFNSRVKDLVDLVLLIQQNSIEKSKLKKAIERTFDKRNTHEFPTTLLAPPEQWRKPFKALAESCGLAIEIDEAFECVKAFLQ